MSTAIPDASAESTTARTPAPPRILELDAIRGIAILLVLVFHYFVSRAATQPGTIWHTICQLLSLSWAGVDLFFVLSGFLIGGILIKNRDSQNYFTAFYVRRAARLLPLYLVVVILYAALAPALLSSGTRAGAWLVADDGPQLPVWSYLLYVQNFLMASREAWGGHWLAPTWSLAVEEQFYLIAPLLLRVVPHGRLPAVLTVLIGAGILARALMFTTTGHWMPGYVLLVTRWDSLFIGILGAYAFAEPALRARIDALAPRLPRLLALLLIGLVLMSVLGIDQDSAFMAFAGFTYLGLMSFVAVMVALLVKNRWTALVFRNTALVRLGTISYGVYLLHQPVLGLTAFALHGGAPTIAGAEGLVVAVLATALTIGLADFSWRVFEKPVLDLGHRIGYRRVVAA